jgi:hypothetical protein
MADVAVLGTRCITLLSNKGGAMTDTLIWFLLIPGAVACVTTWALLRHRKPSPIVAERLGADTVVARRFLLLDSELKIRGSLSMGRDGPLLELSESSGKVRVVLGMIQPDVAGISVYNRDGNTRATLSMDVLGVSLCLYDATGRARAYLNVLDTDGSSSSRITGLTINGESGHSSIMLGAVSDLPTLVLHDEHGQRRLFTMAAEPSGAPHDRQNFFP